MDKFIKLADAEGLMQMKITALEEKIEGWKAACTSALYDSDRATWLAIRDKIDDAMARKGALTVAKNHLKFCEAYVGETSDLKPGVFMMAEKSETMLEAGA